MEEAKSSNATVGEPQPIPVELSPFESQVLDELAGIRLAIARLDERSERAERAIAEARARLKSSPLLGKFLGDLPNG